MEQLTEMDNSFLLAESVRTPMHISPVLIYDQSDLPRGKVRFKEILAVFERNLHKSAIFRRKLAGGALGFDTPYWVEDPDFDLEFHIRHIALPQPGDWRQLHILLARLHAQGLDMKKPLWEAYVIEGLNNVEGLPPNSFAIMLKIHHSAIDGVAGTEILSAIHSLTDEPLPPEVDDDWQGERTPSEVEIWTRAYLNFWRRPINLIQSATDILPKMIKARSAKTEEEEVSETIKTPFNAKVSSYRVTNTIVMDLDTVKAIKSTVDGSTVNDVIVSVVSGGLRKYLEAKGELPSTSLSAGAPINVRSESSSDSRGNQIGLMTIRMASDIEDPMERLQAISHYAQESKSRTSVVGADSLMNLSTGLSPRLINTGLWALTLAANREDVALPFQTLISNVPGPPIPLYLAGARLHLLLGLGPIFDTLGLFHAVISGNGKITINFVSCREQMPDPDFYLQCLQQSWDDLQKAVDSAKNRRRKSGSKKRHTSA